MKKGMKRAPDGTFYHYSLEVNSATHEMHLTLVDKTTRVGEERIRKQQVPLEIVEGFNEDETQMLLELAKVWVETLIETKYAQIKLCEGGVVDEDVFY